MTINSSIHWSNIEVVDKCQMLIIVIFIIVLLLVNYEYNIIYYIIFHVQWMVMIGHFHLHFTSILLSLGLGLIYFSVILINCLFIYYG